MTTWYKRISFDNLYLVGLLLLAFSMPIFRVASTIPMVLLAIVWLIDPRWEAKLKKVGTNWLFWILISYFLWLIISISYTEQTAVGITDLRGKLPLLALPLIIGCIHFLSRKKIEYIFLSFLVGCVAGILMSLGYAIWIYLSEGENLFFYKDLFSLLHIHPSYFATYLIFGLFLMIYFLSRYKKLLNGFLKYLMIAAIFLFLAVIVLSSARMQILISLFLINTSILFYSVLRSRYMLLFLLLAFNGLVVSSVFVLEYPKKRLSDFNQLDYEFDQSKGWNGLTIRLALWQCSWELIREKPILGVGTGAVKQDLMTIYKKHDFKVGIRNNYNPHNQYIQVWLASGIIGLILFLSGLIVPLYYSVKHSSPLYLLFLVLMAIGMVSESMLELQNGVVFYAFYHSIFAFHWKIPPKKWLHGWVYTKKADPFRSRLKC